MCYLTAKPYNLHVLYDSYIHVVFGSAERYAL